MKNLLLLIAISFSLIASAQTCTPVDTPYRKLWLHRGYVEDSASTFTPSATLLWFGTPECQSALEDDAIRRHGQIRIDTSNLISIDYPNGQAAIHIHTIYLVKSNGVEALLLRLYKHSPKISGKQSFKYFQWHIAIDSSAPNASKLKVESKVKIDSADILVISRKDLELFIAQQIGRQTVDQQGRVVGWEKGELMKAVSKSVTNEDYEKIDQVVNELVRRLADVYVKSLQRLKK